MEKLTKLTVLHVEDSEDDAILVEMAFEFAYQEWVEKVSFIRSKTIKEAWEKVHSDRPHIVFLDLSLNNESGHDFLRELKSNPKYASIPVLVMSNSSSKGDVHASYQSQASGYVTKPINFTGLVEVMRKVAAYWIDTVELPL